MDITPELAELIGIIMGDGYIYTGHGKYQIGVVGSPKTDKAYFENVRLLILKVCNKEIKIKERERGLRINFYSKEMIHLLVNQFNLPSGEKSSRVMIPSQIAENWDFAKHTLRGLVDTDGSVFVTKKPGVLKYPSIELNTINKALAVQIREILLQRGFRVTKIWGHLPLKGYKNGKVSYKVCLNGQDNLKKWINEIGFSNPYKLDRALSYLKN